MTFKIGIISDTHGLLRPEAKRHLADVDHIIHGGDIGRPEIIDALRRIAPVSAIRGNVDTGDWAGAYPETEVARLAGRSIYVLHDLRTLQVDPIARGIDVVVPGLRRSTSYRTECDRSFTISATCDRSRDGSA
jgi:putative phosphoesterase